MGFLPSHLRMLIRSHQKRAFDGPVCTLGNQETWASYADLQDIFRTTFCSSREVKDVRLHTSKMFSDDPVLREFAKDFVHAKVFFQMLGLDGYSDIDAFDFDKPTILHDLNQPLPENLKGSFGTVIDGGTLEHIFDVKQGLANTSGLLKVGGQVVHMVSFEMDHGFYSFSPCLLFDFYSTNGFSDLECFILQFDYANILGSYREPVPYFQYRYGMRLDNLFDPERKPAIFFVARKDRDQSESSLPFQGIYARRAGLTQTVAQQDAGGLPIRKPLFDAIVPKLLRRPLTPVRPFFARLRHRVSQHIESRRRIAEMGRI